MNVSDIIAKFKLVHNGKGYYTQKFADIIDDDACEVNLQQVDSKSVLVSKRINNMKNISENKSIIAEGMIVNGSINCDGDIHIKGKILGDVSCGGNLVLEGDVEGNVKAHNIECVKCMISGNMDIKNDANITKQTIINGSITANNIDVEAEVKGDLIAYENITLRSEASIIGNIKAASIQISRNAKIKGDLRIGESAFEGAKTDQQ